MPASVPPQITFYVITNYTGPDDGDESEEITSFDFGTQHVGVSTVTSATSRVRIRNAENTQNEVYATALGPIFYITGEDSEIMASEGNEWLYMKNVSLNGQSVLDDFTAVSNSTTVGYKPLAGDLDPGSYISVDAYLEIPAETSAGGYMWDLSLDYQYTT